MYINFNKAVNLYIVYCIYLLEHSDVHVISYLACNS